MLFITLLGDLNWLAIVVAALASFAVGFGWYSNKGFGKPWRALMGWDEAAMSQMAKQSMTPSIVIGIIGDLLGATLVALLASLLIAYGPMDVLQIAIAVWLGAVVPQYLSTVAWERRPWKLFAINAGYRLISFIVMGLIIGYWQ